MSTTFTIDQELIAELRAEQARLWWNRLSDRHTTDLALRTRMEKREVSDDLNEVDFDQQEKWEAPQTPQTPQSTQPTQEERLARIAHYTQLVSEGKPLFPETETDAEEL